MNILKPKSRMKTKLEYSHHILVSENWDDNVTYFLILQFYPENIIISYTRL